MSGRVTGGEHARFPNSNNGTKAIYYYSNCISLAASVGLVDSSCISLVAILDISLGVDFISFSSRTISLSKYIGFGT